MGAQNAKQGQAGTSTFHGIVLYDTVRSVRLLQKATTWQRTVQNKTKDYDIQHIEIFIFCAAQISTFTVLWAFRELKLNTKMRQNILQHIF